MKEGWSILGVCVALFGGITCFVCIPLIVLGIYVFGWFGEAASVAREEFGPRAMLQKYEEFKDVAATLDAKHAAIDIAVSTTKEMEVGRDKWERADKEQYYLKLNEIQGLKTSYNGLAATYNANMAKFNYRFANVGDLPEGAKAPLPREFREYVNK